jgi:hypothetical protein
MNAAVSMHHYANARSESITSDALTSEDALARIRLHDAAQDMFGAIQEFVKQDAASPYHITTEQLYKAFAETQSKDSKDSTYLKILMRSAYMRATGIKV